MVRTSPDFEISAFTLLDTNANQKEAGDSHHIAQYDESPEYFVRRRGEIFQAAITLPEKRKDANYEISLVLKDPSTQERIMKVSSQASTDDTQNNPEDGSTQSFCAPSSQCSDDENTLLVDIYLSPISTPIGAFTLAARVREEGQEDSSDSRKGEVDCEKQILVLFNPWCSDDDCFLDDEDERTEYVLNEEGFVYQGGSGGSVSPKVWSYDQFDGDVVKTVAYLMTKIPKEKRSSAVLVSRYFSAFINSADDDGILTGNWSGDYTGGTAPYVWNGSQPIFKQFLESNYKEVNFGQCWVFAGVLTTAMRAIGIPCRPVTNYGSAHDANANRTIEYFYKGRSKLDSSDSVWNFHVWNDVWMKRRDLDENGMYDGWQAIDATPQESSDGSYQMGPASLVAVQQGKRTNYDTEFVLAEVNADIIHYQELPNGKFQMNRVDTKSVGKMVITKTVGSDDYIDVVSNYKAVEGSATERATMIRKAGESSLGVDLELTYGDSRPELGKEVKITLVGKKGSDEDLTLNGDAIFFSRAYHGRTRTEIKKIDLTGLKAPFELELSMTPEEYSKYLQSESGFWFHLEVNLMEDAKKNIFAEELDFELDSANCIKTSFDGKATKGESVELPFTITNPFSNITLTGGKASLEGSKRLLSGNKLLVDVPDLAPGQSTDVKVPFTPAFPGAFNVTIDVDFNEACDISTFTKVVVA